MENSDGILPTIRIGNFIIPLVESCNVVKKYGFVDNVRKRRTIFLNGFTELMPLGEFRYAIRHNMSENWHVTNIEDAEVYVKYFLKLN